jgi:predicted DNA-binding transcriptional regulator AlpA
VATESVTSLLLSARDAARSLNISERTLWALTAPRGDIPPVRIGRRVLYAPSDLIAWIDTQKTTATTTNKGQNP